MVKPLSRKKLATLSFRVCVGIVALAFVVQAYRPPIGFIGWMAALGATFVIAVRLWPLRWQSARSVPLLATLFFTHRISAHYFARHADDTDVMFVIGLTALALGLTAAAILSDLCGLKMSHSDGTPTI